MAGRDYWELTIPQLRALMDRRRIGYTTRMRKAELISAIRDMDNNANENRANDADAATNNNRRANNSNNTNRGAEGGASGGLIVNGTNSHNINQNFHSGSASTTFNVRDQGFLFNVPAAASAPVAGGVEGINDLFRNALQLRQDMASGGAGGDLAPTGGAGGDLAPTGGAPAPPVGRAPAPPAGGGTPAPQEEDIEEILDEGDSFPHPNDHHQDISFGTASNHSSNEVDAGDEEKKEDEEEEKDDEVEKEKEEEQVPVDHVFVPNSFSSSSTGTAVASASATVVTFNNDGGGLGNQGQGDNNDSEQDDDSSTTDGLSSHVLDEEGDHADGDSSTVLLEGDGVSSTATTDQSAELI